MARPIGRFHRVGKAMAWARPGAKVTAMGCGALSILATTAACTTPSGTTASGTGSPTGSFVTAKLPTTPTASPSASASA